jgi:NAD(P) transhydrogenase subunit alpha
MADIGGVSEKLRRLSEESADLAYQAELLAEQQAQGVDPFVFGITVFVLACFVGYYVVWKVTPALHTPLMAVTNAISSIIIVGAIVAVGPEGFGLSQWMGFFAVILASINIFGGFVVTQRMLEMFKKKEQGKS